MSYRAAFITSFLMIVEIKKMIKLTETTSINTNPILQGKAHRFFQGFVYGSDRPAGR